MIVYLIASYLIGNVLTAYWVGKYYNTDLRLYRSGNLGARNAGAVIGKAAFFLTLLGDAVKGATVIMAGRYVEFPEWVVAMGGLFVILGHIFPIWLKGKGGKGIATFVGIGLTYQLSFAIAFLIGFLLFIPLLRSATLSMFFGYIAYIGAIIYFDELQYSWPMLIAIIIIMYRHRFDFKQSIDNFKA